MSKLKHIRTSAMVFTCFTLLCCIALIAQLVYVAVVHDGNNIHSFAEETFTISDNWTVEDASGNISIINLPINIDYGVDGYYTLTKALPQYDEPLKNPVIMFYSNYVDLSISIEGDELYSYPKTEAAFSGATGNTYHFVRLPIDFSGKTISIRIRCQLGDDIDYLINPPVIGAKATLLKEDIMSSMPQMVLSACMLVLSFGLFVMYFMVMKNLPVSDSTIYTALFAMLFAVYVFCETKFAQVIIPNGYLVCCNTLMLLALMPIPLMGFFADEVSRKLRFVPKILMTLCSVNFITQMILNFTGVKSIRVLLPLTHICIILSISVMVVCLIMSDKKEKPKAKLKLLSAAPMIIGGLVDIILIWIEKPSLNNSFWFVFGVTIFILIQFFGYIRNALRLYKASLEISLYKDLAYRDMLTNIGNRNAYELKLRELSGKQLDGTLGCIVIDICGLKIINDTYGHHAGDAAIVGVGKLLNEMRPKESSSYRTGGDEFITMLYLSDEQATRELADKIAREAEKRGKAYSIPLRLSIGYGNFKPEDKNVSGFVRRIDANMYVNKRSLKESNSYPYNLTKF